MAQQQHSSEIVVSIDDSAISRAIRNLTDRFRGLQRDAQTAIDAAGQAAVRADGAVSSSRMGGAPPSGAGGAMPPATGGRPTTPTGGTPPPQGQSSLGGMAGATIPFVGGIVRSLINTRMSRTAEAQALEIPQAELRLSGGYTTGGIGAARRAGTSFGMTPQETVEMLRAFSAQVGEETPLSGSLLNNIMEAQRFGISSRTFAGFGAGGGVGGGALSGDVATETRLALSMARVGRAMGLTGGGTERFLASIAQSTQMMATQGLRLDTLSYGNLVSAVSFAAEQGGNKALMGEGAVRAVGRVRGMTGGALQGFRGQFGNIGQGVLQAAAARGALSPLDMISNLEAMMQSPSAALDALKEMGLPPDLMRLALVGAGASTEEAKYLLEGRAIDKERGGVLGSVPARVGGQGARVTGLELSRAASMRANELTTIIETNKQASLAMIKISADIEKMALSTTANNAVLTRVLTGMGTMIEEALREGGSVDRLSRGVEGLKEYIREVIGL